jgi:multiple sugar transport system substrate-binding protein
MKLLSPSGFHLSPLNRRRFLQLTGATVAGTWLSGCAPTPITIQSTPAAPVATDATAAVTLLGQAGSGEERVIQDAAGEFTAAQGVEVNINPQPWETLMEKIQADIRSGAPTVDVFWSDLEFAYTLWPNLLPLNDFIESTGYPMDGFFPSVAEYGLGIGGQEGVRYGLPIMTDTQLCWYRSDMIDTFPTTWDEFEQMLKELTGGGQYALGNSGVVAQGIGRFLSRYWSIPGATLLDEDWNPKINSEEGVFALEMYRRQATSYSTPGFQAWEYTDAVNAFLNGDVAIHEGWPEVMLPWLNDPERNQTVGENWGAAAYPEGGAAQLVQHNLILFNTSKNPEAAFNFMAYCTDRDMAKRIINDYNVDSPRQDVWEEVLPDNPVAQKFFPSWSSAMQVARPFARHLPQWLELFISIGEAVTATVAGAKTPQEALDETAERWSQSIAKAKPDFPYQEVVGI